MITSKLKDLIDLIIDYRGKTPKKLGGDWSESGYRVFSAKNIKTGEIVSSESIRYVNNDLYRSWMKDEIQKGDILITSEAPFGQIYFWDSDEKIVLGQRLFAIRPKKSVNGKYLYYYMTGRDFQCELKARATGTTVTGLRQPELLHCQVSMPSKEQQDYVAHLLGTLDKKIQINVAINDNLFAQAKLLFNKEVSDVAPIPFEWKKGTLLDIATYTNGLAMQRFRPADDEIGIPVLKIKELRQGFCDSASELCSPGIAEECLISDGDVIFSWSGSLLIDLWGGGVCGLNQHLFKVTSSKYPKWFYYLWTLHHLDKFITIAADKATTMGHIKRGDLAQAEVFIPSCNDINRIGRLISPIVDLMVANKVESRKLEQLRDSMLTKLIVKM